LVDLDTGEIGHQAVALPEAEAVLLQSPFRAVLRNTRDATDIAARGGRGGTTTTTANSALHRVPDTATGALFDLTRNAAEVREMQKAVALGE
jgi:hypothetical protein